MTRLEDKLDLAVGEVDRLLHEEYEEKVKQARAYATALANGASPHAGGRYGGPFAKLNGCEMDMIDAARREALGRVPNPFSVSSSHSYKVFDYLVQRDELVLLEEIRKAVPIGYGSYQIDTALNPRTLKAAGWKLRKGKVNGKVAYMLEEVPEDERA